MTTFTSAVTAVSHAPAHSDVLLSAKEVLRKLKRGKSWLYAAIQNGEFPGPLKLGKCSAWLQSDLDAYLARKVAERGVH